MCANPAYSATLDQPSGTRPTLRRVAVALFLAEVAWWLAAHLQLFSAAAQKGWPSIICLVGVVSILAVMVLWILVQLALRQRFQFGLGTLLLLAVVVAIAFGWFMADFRAALRQKRLVAVAGAQGGSALYDFNFNEPEHAGSHAASLGADAIGFRMFTGERPGRTSWHRLFGDDFFHRVRGVRASTDAALLVFQDLSDPEIVWLNDSLVTDAGLAALSHWKRLRLVDLRSVPAITDAGLVHLAQMAQLQVVMLRHDHITDEGLKHLAGLKQLQQLDLGMTQVSGAGMRHLAGLTRLTQLLFWGNKIDDAGLAALSDLGSLQMLELGGAPITDAGLATIGNSFRQLSNLNIRGAKCTDAGVAHLVKLQHLTLLDLFNTPVSDASIEQLVNLKKLETLRLGETKITPAGLATLRQALPNCKLE